MTEIYQKYKVITVILAIVVTVGLLSTYITNQRLNDLETTSRSQLADQKTLLATIAETTARNGADSVTESIVIDCPLEDRSRFDILLGSLDQGLSQNELNELERLFDLCGSFFAERKAVMVARLTREIEIYADQVELLSTITNADEVTKQQLLAWQKLADNEQTQSVLFSNLVRLQKEIIDTLLEGSVASSEEIITILNEVHETREALLMTKTQTDTLRADLTSL